jgi:hypothetical protein
MPRLFLAALFMAFLATSVRCQEDVLSPNIGGRKVQCSASGIPVYTDISLAIGYAAQAIIGPDGKRRIGINPGVVKPLPKSMQLFIYAHECAHHMNRDITAGMHFQHNSASVEENADRVAIRLLRDSYMLNAVQVGEIADYISTKPPISPYYLPRIQRSKWIAACYRTTDISCGGSDAHYVGIIGDQ